MSHDRSVSDFEAALAAGRSMGRIITEHNGVPAVMVPENWELKSLENLLPKPARKRVAVAFESLESFLTYVGQHKTATTIITVSLGCEGAKFTAHIDFHGKAEDATSWCSHTAAYTTQPKVEWQRWMGMDKHQFNQEDFAYFLETNHQLFVDPNGAEILEMISTLQGKSNVRIDRAVKIQTGGVKIDYEEDVTLRGNAGVEKGVMEIPSVLTLGIAPFKHGSTYKVQARLRFRIANQRITFWYETIDPHIIIEAAISDITDKISKQTSIAPLFGKIQ